MVKNTLHGFRQRIKVEYFYISIHSAGILNYLQGHLHFWRYCEFEVSSTCKTRADWSCLGQEKSDTLVFVGYDTFCTSCRPENFIRHNFLCSFLRNPTKLSSPFFWWFWHDLHIFLSHNIDPIPLLTQKFLGPLLPNLILIFTPVFYLSSPCSLWL